MHEKPEIHSRHTFEDAFSDYVELSGFCISGCMQKSLVKKFYRPELVFQALSALQYGDDVWLLNSGPKQTINGVYSLNIKSNQIVQLI